MARHIKLGNDADAPIARILEDLAHLVLGVVHAVGALLLKERNFLLSMRKP